MLVEVLFEICWPFFFGSWVGVVGWGILWTRIGCMCRCIVRPVLFEGGDAVCYRAAEHCVVGFVLPYSTRCGSRFLLLMVRIRCSTYGFEEPDKEPEKNLHFGQTNAIIFILNIFKNRSHETMPYRPETCYNTGIAGKI